ncbi:MAG: sulfide/dihydroorotate dehydrogenase-like FAD/NAD-binding protein [Lentisphaeria bacterium]|nr:sulfide/dihydroorotate dehydrogenase-like FAD/NAD-binding protein [Lentisphaeria bacterium]
MSGDDYTVLQRQQLSENVFRLKIHAPSVAVERRPGQFVLVAVDADYGERIPLTIADADPQAGTIDLVFQKVGLTTSLMAELPVGSHLAAVLGPLGCPTHITPRRHVVCVGGGIGVAPMHPIAKAFHEAGSKVSVIVGARSRELVILEPELRAFADEFILCTDDGSAGRKALVTEPLKEICEREEHPDLVVAIGPPVMMKFCTAVVEPFADIDILVSLNTIMVDGTGMCGGCRVRIGNEIRFVCVDGPEFDGRLVDWDSMLKRLQAYRPIERRKLEDHICRMEAAADAREKTQQ